MLVFIISADLRIDGDIRINGQRMKLKHLKRISGFVYQDDLFISTLTVTEHLNFAVRLCVLRYFIVPLFVWIQRSSSCFFEKGLHRCKIDEAKKKSRLVFSRAARIEC